MNVMSACASWWAASLIWSGRRMTLIKSSRGVDRNSLACGRELRPTVHGPTVAISAIGDQRVDQGRQIASIHACERARHRFQRLTFGSDAIAERNQARSNHQRGAEEVTGIEA
jgi:hypothetical protein